MQLFIQWNAWILNIFKYNLFLINKKRPIKSHIWKELVTIILWSENIDIEINRRKYSLNQKLYKDSLFAYWKYILNILCAVVHKITWDQSYCIKSELIGKGEIHTHKTHIRPLSQLKAKTSIKTIFPVSKLTSDPWRRKSQ